MGDKVTIGAGPVVPRSIPAKAKAVGNLARVLKYNAPDVTSINDGRQITNEMLLTILLIGGAGYIGSHILLCCLEAVHEVAVLDEFSNSSPEALTWLERLTRGLDELLADRWQGRKPEGYQS